MFAAAAAAAAHKNGDDAGGGLYCARMFDNITCWPDTAAGRLAITPCPTHFRGLPLSAGDCTNTSHMLDPYVYINM